MANSSGVFPRLRYFPKMKCPISWFTKCELTCPGESIANSRSPYLFANRLTDSLKNSFGFAVMLLNATVLTNSISSSYPKIASPAVPAILLKRSSPTFENVLASMHFARKAKKMVQSSEFLCILKKNIGGAK